MHRNNMSVLGLLSALALVTYGGTSAARADVIYSNLGSDGSFNTGSNWTIDGSHQIAGKFRVTGSAYRLSTVEVALSGTPSYVYLREDAAGSPGEVVETWYLPAGTITESPQVIALSSAARRPLRKGATYWVATAYGSAKWYWNSTGATGVGSRVDIAPWTYSSSDATPAFRVSGDPALGATALPSLADYPGSEVLDVNTAGQSVGDFLRDGGDLACLWTQGAYTLPDQADGVFDDGISSYADLINAQGQVAGRSYDPGNHARAFLWTPDSPNGTTGQMIGAGVALEGDNTSEPIALNDAGQLLCRSVGPPYSTNRSFVLSPDGTRDVLTIIDPVMGSPRDIDVIRGDMNSSGQVVGTVQVYPYTTSSVVLWQKVDGVPTATLLSTSRNCVAAFINDAGQVVCKGGWGAYNPWFYSPGKEPKTIDVLGTFSGLESATIEPGGIAADGRVVVLAGTRVFVWRDDGTPAGAFTEIPVNGWVKPNATTTSGFINAQGQVAGTVQNPYTTERRSYFWDPASPTAVQELCPLPGCTTTGVTAISDAGLIGGHCLGGDGYYRAAVWSTVVTPNQPPVLSNVPTTETILEMAPYTFTATATDADLDSLTFSLDGAPAGAAIDPATGVFTWTPSEEQGPGAYAFTVSVTDGTASVDAAITLNVTEANRPPSLDIPGVGYLNEGEVIDGPMSGTDPDVPAQTLTYSADGLPAGATYDPATGHFHWAPTEAQGPATYTITFTVTDDQGASDSQTFTLLVVEANVPPSLTQPADQTVDEESTLSFQLQATDTDLPAQTLTYSLVVGPDGMTVSPDGLVTWTPTEAQGAADYSGIQVRVTDGVAEDLKTFKVTVNEVNRPPVLDPLNSWVWNEGLTLSFTVSGSDADIPAQTLSYAAWTLPEGATFDPNTREFVWTPSEEQGPGEYTMFFTLTDGAGETAEQQVHITVQEANEPPTVFNPEDYTVPEGEPFYLVFQANDPDVPTQAIAFHAAAGGLPAGATLSEDGTFRWTPSEAQGPGDYTVAAYAEDSMGLQANLAFTLHVVEVNQAPVLSDPGYPKVDEGSLLSVQLQATDADDPAQSLSFTLTSGPAGMSLSPTGLLTWTPAEADGPAEHAVTVQVSDGTASSETSFGVTVNEVNTPPTLTVPATLAGQTGSPVSFTASATDPDIPANNLTYSLTGTVPAGAAIDAATGAFTWTPFVAGTYPISVTVSDGNGGSDTKTVSVTVALIRSLTLSGVPPSATVNSLETLTFTAVAVDSDPAATITYSLNRRAPAGATIGAASGVFTWTPTEAQGPGTYTITVTATDSSRLTASQSIVVTVTEANTPPTLKVPTTLSGQVNVPVTFTATATDPDIPANTLTFGLDHAPTGATINAATGVFTWTPATAGTYAFAVTVSDGQGGLDSKTVTVTVAATPALELTVSSILRQAKAIVVTVEIANPGLADVDNVTVGTATLAAVASTSRLPVALRTIRASASKSLTLKFPSTIADGSTTLALGGSSSLGSFSASIPVTVK